MQVLEKRSTVLEISDLRTEFDTPGGIVHAVNGISYQVHKGETVGIVGESGCGKSVSVLSVLRLLPRPAARMMACNLRDLDDEALLLYPRLVDLRRAQVQFGDGRLPHFDDASFFAGIG